MKKQLGTLLLALLMLLSIVPGQCFAEAFACAPGSVSTVSVVAQAESAVLWLNVRRLLGLYLLQYLLLCPLAEAAYVLHRQSHLVQSSSLALMSSRRLRGRWWNLSTGSSS